MYVCIYILFVRGYLIFIRRKTGERAKRRISYGGYVEKKREEKGYESRMQRGMAGQGYIGVKSEAASLERATGGSKKTCTWWGER